MVQKIEQARTEYEQFLNQVRFSIRATISQGEAGCNQYRYFCWNVANLL